MSIGGATVLIVEDDPSDRNLARHALRKSKFISEIVEARDGEEALDIILRRGAYSGRATAELPRLVLLDIKLPILDGFDVLAEMRKHPDTQGVPVVMMTSSRVDKDIAESYRLGANSYVQKPVDFDRFREVLEQIASYWLTANETASNSG
jgi:two-component system, response regulator